MRNLISNRLEPMKITLLPQKLQKLKKNKKQNKNQKQPQKTVKHCLGRPLFSFVAGPGIHKDRHKASLLEIRGAPKVRGINTQG